MKPIYVQMQLFSLPPSPPPPPPPRLKRCGIFSVGDRVEIRAKGMLYGRRAVIEDFDGLIAIIRSPEWAISRRYHTRDLFFLRSKP